MSKKISKKELKRYLEEARSTLNSIGSSWAKYINLDVFEDLLKEFNNLFWTRRKSGAITMDDLRSLETKYGQRITEGLSGKHRGSEVEIDEEWAHCVVYFAYQLLYFIHKYNNAFDDIDESLSVFAIKLETEELRRKVQRMSRR